MAKPIGTIGNVDSLTVGGVTFVDLTNLIVVGAAWQNSTGTKSSTLRKPGGTAGYQVTSGKTLTLRAWHMAWHDVTAAANDSVIFLYSDNDIGFDSATAFTNPVYMFGTSSRSTANHAVVANTQDGPLFFPVAATKYAGLSPNVTNVSGSILAFGYEA